MQNPYEKFKSEPKKEVAYFVPIGGNYSCQICYETVTEARYFPNDSILDWTCTQGHKSEIEGFNIF